MISCPFCTSTYFCNSFFQNVEHFLAIYLAFPMTSVTHSFCSELHMRVLEEILTHSSWTWTSSPTSFGQQLADVWVFLPVQLIPELALAVHEGHPCCAIGTAHPWLRPFPLPSHRSPGCWVMFHRGQTPAALSVLHSHCRINFHGLLIAF